VIRRQHDFPFDQIFGALWFAAIFIRGWPAERLAQRNTWRQHLAQFQAQGRAESGALEALAPAIKVEVA
jgi:hypothetical protein